ncbi:MAG: hypothetical protein ACTSU5_17580 [Promethearchaeota archaeon]
MDVFQIVDQLRVAIERFKRQLGELTSESRDEAVYRLFRKRFQEACDGLECAVDATDAKPEKVGSKTVGVRAFIDQITEENKLELIPRVLALIEGISESDKEVIQGTFAQLPVESLKKELESLQATFGTGGGVE